MSDMADVIDLGAVRSERQKRQNDDGNVDFAVIGSGAYWKLEDRGRPWTADELLAIADDLRSIARALNDRALAARGDEQDQVLVDVQAFESGRVRSWISNRIETEEQVAWAIKQIGKADIQADPRGSLDSQTTNS